MEPETIYSSDYSPDPTSAREVFAFVMTRPEAFVEDVACASCRAEQLDAVKKLLEPAKAEALRKWYDAHRDRAMV